MSSHRNLSTCTRLVSLLALMIAASVLASCASPKTKLTEEWASPEFQPTSLQDVMVVAAARKPEVRRAFEDQVVAELRADNIRAFPSYPSLNTGNIRSADDLKQAVRQSGASSVLVLQLTGAEVKQESPGPAGFDDWYSHVYSSAGPSADTSTTYKSQARLFDLQNNKLAWSGALTTNNADKNDINEVSKDYAKKLVEAMEK